MFILYIMTWSGLFYGFTTDLYLEVMTQNTNTIWIYANSAIYD